MRSYHVAIVGAGPSGFFTATSLLNFGRGYTTFDGLGA
jgi:2-polyprenyl-6-methoxyphenol hydroxylase-like FAD-dependent oxidoreductase